MLWFSIPIVVFLASIPVLIIVSQTMEFKMLRNIFTVCNFAMLYQFGVACYYAYTKPFGGMFFFALVLTAVTIWCIEEVNEMEAK